MLTLNTWIRIIIEIIVGLVVAFILIPLTTWRLPTLYFIYKNERLYKEIGGDPITTRP
jgi:uncharacterized membrane-anchored protein YhcB (DUF1043 family)